MQKFDRGSSPFHEQKIKKQYNNQWDQAFSQSREHADIADALYQRQNHLCAYCERHIKQQSEGHIEHLERRKNNPSRIFDWTNMFYSCNDENTCGKYKDNPKNNIEFQILDIVDPSKDNPEDFFAYNPADGSILPKSKDKTIEQRANETIRIFHLNEEKLKNIRKQIMRNIAQYAEYGFSKQDILAMTSSGNTDCPSVSDFLLK